MSFESLDLDDKSWLMTTMELEDRDISLLSVRLFSIHRFISYPISVTFLYYVTSPNSSAASSTGEVVHMMKMNKFN